MSNPLDVSNRLLQQPPSRQDRFALASSKTLSPLSAQVSFNQGLPSKTPPQDVTAFHPLSAPRFSGQLQKLTPVQFTEAQVKDLTSQIEAIEGKDQARIFLFNRLKELKAVEQFLAQLEEGQKGLRQLIEKHQARLKEEIQTVQPEGSTLPISALLGEVETEPRKQMKTDLASLETLSGEAQQEAFAKLIEGASGEQSVDLIALLQLQDVNPRPLPPVDPKKQELSLLQKIQGSQPLGLSGSYWYGVMTHGGDGKITVTSPNPELQQWAKIINSVGLSQEALAQIPEGGMPLVIQVRGGLETPAPKVEKNFFEGIKSTIDHYNPVVAEHETPDLLKAFIEGHIKPVYSVEVEHKAGFLEKLKDSVPFLKGNKGESSAEPEEESEGPSFTMWPFLEGMLNRTKPSLSQGKPEELRAKLASYGDTLQVFENDKANDLAKLLQYLPVGQVHTPLGFSSKVQQELKALSAPYQVDLAAYTVGEAHYLAPKAEHKAYAPMVTGMLAGFAGETAVEKLIPEGAGIAKTARIGVLFLVDLIDNFLGQAGMVMSRVRPGENANGEWAKAGVSAGFGASLGFLTAYPRAYVLSESHVSPEARAIIGGLGSLGTAMAVPLNLRATLNKNAKMVEKLIEKGVIPQEKGKKIHDQAIDIALKDMMTEVGSASSIMAFFGVPVISGLIMEAERLGIPRSVIQKTFMSVAPAMENILTGALMFHQQNGKSIDPLLKVFGNTLQSAETKKGNLRQHILSANAEGKDRLDEKILEGNFGNKAAEALTRFTVASPLGPTAAALGLAGMYGYVLKKGAFGPKTHVAEKNLEGPLGQGVPATAGLNPTAVPLQLTMNGMTQHQGIHQFLSARATGVGERPTFATLVSPSIESGSRMITSGGSPSSYGAFSVPPRPVVAHPPVSASQLKSLPPQG